MTLPVPPRGSELSITLQRILQLAKEAIPFDRGAIHLIRDGRLWTCAVYANPGVTIDPELEGSSISLHEGFSGYVAREGVPFLSENVAEEERVRPARYTGSNRSIQSFLGVPLRLEDEVIGVFEMDSHTVRFFNASHIAVAEVVADQAAVAIHNAWLAEERKQMAQRRELLLNSVEAINSSLSLPELLKRIVQHAGAIVSGQAALALLEREALVWNIPLSTSAPPISNTVVQEPHDSELYQILHGGRAHSLKSLPASLSGWVQETGPVLVIPILDPYQRPLGLLVVVRSEDMTEYNADEVKLLTAFAHQAATAMAKARLLQAEQAERHVSETLRQMSRTLSGSLSMEEVAGVVLDHLQRLLPFDNASVGLLQSDRLELIAVRGQMVEEVLSRIEIDQWPLVKEAIDKRQAVVLADTTLEGVIGDTTSYRSWMGIPVSVHNTVVAFLTCASKQPNLYDARTVRIAAMCADQAGLALQNARLYDDAQRLRDYYQQVVDSVEQTIFTVDRTGNVSGVNKQWHSFASLWSGTEGAQEPVGRVIHDVLPESLQTHVLALLRAVLAGEEQGVVEWQAPSSAGSVRHFQIQATPLSKDGQSVQGVTFVITETTSARALQLQLQSQNRALAESRDQLSALLDATESGILMSDGHDKIVHANSLLEEFLGISRDEMVGKPVRQVMTQVAERFRDPEGFRRRVEWLYDHTRVVVRDNLTTADENPRLFQRYSAPVYGSVVSQISPKPGRIEVYSDVTESRRLEERMRRYLEEMVAVSHIGVMLSNEENPEKLLNLICEKGAALLRGSAAIVALLREQDAEQLVIPAACGLSQPINNEEYEESVHFSVAGDAIKQRRPVSISVQGSDPSDVALLRQQWKMSSALSVPLVARDRVTGALVVFDEQARSFEQHEIQLLQIFASQAAVALENTQLLQEARVRQAELETLTEHNNLLIENSPVGIAVVGVDGQVVRANPAYAAIVGSSVEEIEGRPLASVFRQVDQTELFSLVMATSTEGTAREKRDFFYPYLERGPAWFDLSFNPLKEHGTVTGIMMTLVDITERKRLESDLRQRNERIRRQLAQHRALYEIGTRINAEHDVQKLLEALMTSVQRVFEADGLVILLPGDGGTLLPVARRDVPEAYVEHEQLLHAQSAVGAALRQRTPIHADLERDPRAVPIREAAREAGLRSAVYVPFVFRDEVVGVMALYHREPHEYSPEEMEILAIFASQATTALQNAQFYTSIVQSRSHLNAILQSMEDGVVALDNTGCVTYINQRLFDLLRIVPERREEWIGRKTEELWPELHRVVEHFIDHGHEEQFEGVVRVAIEVQDPERTVEMAYAPIVDESAGKVGRLFLLHDITEIRANERMKDELVSVLSHELRTPLTSILGYSKLLADRPEGPIEKRVRWANQILNKSRLLNRLINEVLDLSRLNMERFDLKVAPTDISLLLGRVVDEQRLTTDEHTLKVEVEGDLSTVPADAQRLDQLLTNLVTNAIKYSPEGGTITIGARREEPWIRLTVSDQGMGIAPEYHDRIFEPFFRVDNSTTRNVYGTGLGLSLCKGIAEAHGGEIKVESDVGQGSTFHVLLPLETTGRQPEGDTLDV